MKPVNKSELFKKAWKLYRNSLSVWTFKYERTFSDCLKSAWFLLRKEMHQAAGTMDLFFTLAKAAEPVAITQQGYNDFYRGSKYYGD